MSDIRQLEALLGAGPKQTLSSQAKNDSLFPLSEMEEDASSVCYFFLSFSSLTSFVSFSFLVY